MKKIVGLIFLLCVATFCSYVVFIKLSRLETVSPVIEKAILAVYATGEVEPLLWAKVSAVTTATIQEIFVSEGEEVAKGEVLAFQDNSVEQAVMIRLQSKLLYLKKENDRNKELIKKGVVSQNKLDESDSNYKQALAELHAQEKLLNRIRITSPINGVLLRKDIELGELAKQGETIFWIGNSTPLRITAQVDEEDIPLVKIGQKVLIKSDSFPDEIMEGILMQITPKGDPGNKQFRVRISLPQDTKLKVGMTVEINIIAKEFEKAIMLPISAVLKNKVYRQKENKIIPIEVKTGITTKNTIQIISDNISVSDIILSKPKDSIKE